MTLDKLIGEKRLEITYVEEGKLEFVSDSGSKRIFEEKALNCNIFDKRLKGISSNTPHTHITVGVSGIFDIEIIKGFELLKDLSVNENVVILPEVLPPEISYKYKNIILSVIYNYTARNHLKAISSLFELFSALCDASFKYERINAGVSDSNDLYCEKIKNYIYENIYRKITLKDISESLNISEGYICRIFKKTCGISIINFINKTKTDMASDMILTKKITTSELALQLGIDDEKYFCRLFKQYTGKTVSEYRKMAESDSL